MTGVTRRAVASLALAVAGLANETRAGTRTDAPYRWRNVTVGGGGFIPGIVFSRVERGLAYARSDMGGAYRFDAEEARWSPLMDASPLSSDFGIESIAADPIDADVVHAAVGVNGGDPGRHAAVERPGSDLDQNGRSLPHGRQRGRSRPGRAAGGRSQRQPHPLFRIASRRVAALERRRRDLGQGRKLSAEGTGDAGRLDNARRPQFRRVRPAKRTAGTGVPDPVRRGRRSA